MVKNVFEQEERSGRPRFLVNVNIFVAVRGIEIIGKLVIFYFYPLKPEVVFFRLEYRFKGPIPRYFVVKFCSLEMFRLLTESPPKTKVL